MEMALELAIASLDNKPFSHQLSSYLICMYIHTHSHECRFQPKSFAQFQLNQQIEDVNLYLINLLFKTTQLVIVFFFEESNTTI